MDHLEMLRREREAARSSVLVKVRQGRSPAALFDADDLAWAFSPEELQRLEQEAERVADTQQERERARAESERIKAEAQTIIKEWDAKRYAEAEAEARKRLGISK